jgi:hypothetical protein
MNCIMPIGVEKREWLELEGERQSWRIRTPRMGEIPSGTLAAGSTPPWPVLTPWQIFNSTILRRCDLC